LPTGAGLKTPRLHQIALFGKKHSSRTDITEKIIDLLVLEKSQELPQRKA
jgi:hypothetical protein